MSEENKANTSVYVLLASVDGGTTFEVVGKQRASSKASALSHFYETHTLPEIPEEHVGAGGELVFQAIPESSWKPLKPGSHRPRVPFAEA